MTLEAKRTLIYAILKFLRDELKQENISPDFKESLEGIFFLLSCCNYSVICNEILLN